MKQSLLVGRFKHLLFACLIMLAVISALQGWNNAVIRIDGSQDTQWGPARALLQQQNPYDAFLGSESSANTLFILSQAPNYPASGLVFMFPYALLDWPLAKVLWALTSLMCTGYIVFAVIRLLPSESSWETKTLLALLFIIGTPWRNGVGNGQHALFTLAFFLAAIHVYRVSSITSGVLLSVSWLKYTIALPFSIFFGRSKRGIIVLFLAIVCSGPIKLDRSWAGIS